MNEKEFSKKYFDDGSVFELELEEQLPPRYIGCCSLKKLNMSAAAEKFMQYINSPLL